MGSEKAGVGRRSRRYASWPASTTASQMVAIAPYLEEGGGHQSNRVAALLRDLLFIDTELLKNLVSPRDQLRFWVFLRSISTATRLANLAHLLVLSMRNAMAVTSESDFAAERCLYDAYEEQLKPNTWRQLPVKPALLYQRALPSVKF